jgi:hypothetical protein
MYINIVLACCLPQYPAALLIFHLIWPQFSAAFYLLRGSLPQEIFRLIAQLSTMAFNY